MLEMNESDWKVFRQVHQTALERFFTRVVAEIAAIANDASKPDADRYHAIYQLQQSRDQELAQGFDNPRRSQAGFQLALLRRWQLVTDEEFSRFSPDIQSRVTGLEEFSR